MAELAPVQIDSEAILQGVLARTPWIEEKFAAVHGLLLAIADEDPNDFVSASVDRSRLGYVGDTEFRDYRLAARFDTDERMTTVTDYYRPSGQRNFNASSMTMGHVTREFNSYPRHDILWARSEGGLFVLDVARAVARGRGTFRLALSSQYERELARTTA